MRKLLWKNDRYMIKNKIDKVEIEKIENNFRCLGLESFFRKHYINIIYCIILNVVIIEYVI